MERRFKFTVSFKTSSSGVTEMKINTEEMEGVSVAYIFYCLRKLDETMMEDAIKLLKQQEGD